MAEESAQEARGLLERLGGEEGGDLEAMEFFVRRAMLGAGARVLESLLEAAADRERAPWCGQKHPPAPMASTGKRPKTIQTLLGKVGLRRRRYACVVCGAVRYPFDETLGVQATGFSPGVRRLMSRAGAMESFSSAAQSLSLYAELPVGAKDVERAAEETGRSVEAWGAHRGAVAVARAGCDEPVAEEGAEKFYISFDGTGVPMRREALEGAAGKGPDGKARTREVKVGCVFTQTGLDDRGRPVRDPASTTYTAAIEPSVDFGHRIHAEAARRGLGRAQQVIVLTDGAAYNKSIVDEHFPHATRIIDLYHAREHLAEFARDVARVPLSSSWFRKARKQLDRGWIEKLTAALQDLLPRSGPRRKQGLNHIEYFRTNAPHMRYGRFRRKGLFVGSGVIEAACRTVVGQRLKRSGMFWSLYGANAIIALRCCLLSNRFEQFWEDQAA